MIAIAPNFRRKRILAVASGGGHWVELMRIKAAFEGADLAFVTVKPEYARDVPGCRFYTVRDATRWNKLGTAIMATQIFRIVMREKPDVVVTTGAAPGYFAIRFAKLIEGVGAKTIWLDSIANVDELSLSGQMAGRYADLWLTQWPHLAAAGQSAQAEGNGEALHGANHEIGHENRLAGLLAASSRLFSSNETAVAEHDSTGLGPPRPRYVGAVL
jgi:UDP-N-acetylglucosamine:LPS N-acetylglucosamine transferase